MNQNGDDLRASPRQDLDGGQVALEREGFSLLAGDDLDDRWRPRHAE